MLAEIGGYTGLLLGLSVVNIVAYVDALLKRMTGAVYRMKTANPVVT